MANITVLEALQLSLNATKKYVDENNQLYWMEPYEITGTKTKLANVDISTLTKNRLYTFNYKKYSEIDKVSIKKIYDDGTKKSITTLSQGLEYIYFSDLSSIGFIMYIKYSHGTSSKITGTFGSTASEYTSTLTPMVLDTQSNKEFIPTKEYDPATKKYVDEKVAEANASGGYTHPDSHPASMITGLATVATSGDYNDLTNRLLKVLPSNTTATDLYNLEAGVYLTEGQINFNILDDAQLYNGIEPYVIFPNSLIASEGGGEITNLSKGIYYTFNSEGYIEYAGTVNNSWGAPPANSIPDQLSDEMPASTNAIKRYVDANKFSGDYNDLTNRPIKVLPDDTTVADLYNLEMGIYLLTNNIEFNITDDTNMENGVVFNKFSPFTLIIYRGNGMVGDLSSNIYYVFTSDGSLISAGTTDNSWAGTIATVATTGSYNDLTDKPTIPTAYTHPATHPASMITGLSTVATSGSYADLTNKPTIPTVTNDLTNTLKTNYDTAYTHSQSTHAPSNAQKNSDITKAEIEAKLIGNITTHTHSQYLTEHQSLEGYVKTTDLSTVATTGSYNDLTDKPTIPSAYTHPNTHPASMITGLSKVATSGSYNDLSNKPTIPTIPNSLPANGGNADTVNNFRLWKGTQAQYDAITTKDSNTIYMITE